jgi:hypothetical protein
MMVIKEERTNKDKERLRYVVSVTREYKFELVGAGAVGLLFPP